MKLLCVKHFPEAHFSLYFLGQRLPEGEAAATDPEAEASWGVMKRMHDPGGWVFCLLVVVAGGGVVWGKGSCVWVGGWVCLFIHRPFLWRHSPAPHKFTVLELTHNHGTEDDPAFAYHNGNTDPRGFGHVGFLCDDLEVCT